MNMKFTSFMLTLVCAFTTYMSNAQCIPTAVRPVFGTTSAASGLVTFSNVPTGNVIQVNCPAANTIYNIDMCATNPGTNIPDGTNDGQVTVLNANSAAAVSLAFGDDGCANVVPSGFGPTVMTFTAPAAGTFFLYLTEWNAAGTAQCIADGANISYIFNITIVAPPSNDLALDSAALPALYTSVAIPQLQPFSVGARIKNVGSTTVANTAVAVRIRNLTTNAVVSTQTLTGPTSLASGASTYLPGTAYVAPAVEAFYEFRYICSMSTTNGNTLNDTAFRYLAIDNSLLAIDDAILFGDIDNALGINNNQAILGQKFTFTNPTSVDTVFAFFNIAPAGVGEGVRVLIYNTAGGVPTTRRDSSAIYTFVTGDQGGKLQTFTFSPNLIIPAGTYYFGVEQRGNSNMGLGLNLNNNVGGNTLLSTTPYTTWAPIEATPFRGSFLIWVNTKCTLGATANAVNPTCGLQNGSVSTTVTGNTGSPTYSWSNSATTAGLTNLNPGTYNVSVTADGCVKASSAVLTNVGTAPTLSTSSVAAACGGSNGEATVTVTNSLPNPTFAWSNSQTTGTITGLASGNYTVTVTASGCTSTATVFVSNTGGPTASISSSTNVACNGGTTGAATATANGGTAPYNYLWSNAANSATANGLAAGTYTVTITDASSCVATVSVVVTQPSAIVPSVAPTVVSCFNGNNGAIAASANGGTGAYSYSWSNGVNTANAANLTPGTYCVTISDANSCTATACQTLANPTQLQATASSTNVTCNGVNNGQASVSANGGTGNLSYSWSNNASGASVNNLAAGTYTVTTSDANGCTVTASLTITQPTAITLTVECTSTIQGQTTGTAVATAQGGTVGNGYTYTWSAGGSTTANAANLAEGIVTVTVTDANNCTVSADCEVQFTVNVKETAAGINTLSVYPNPSNGLVNLAVELANTSALTIVISDVRGAVVYTTNEATTNSLRKGFDLSHLAKGMYNVSIKTDKGVVNKQISLQ
jgi:hypothetical protein